ncbi:MAG: hypothetical protein FWC19_08415 [Treponema sp.]|nr:hypothetical protein [Treponema sp.]
MSYFPPSSLNFINLVLAAVGLAMGATVIVLSVINNYVSASDLIKMLGIAVFSLGLFALNTTPKEKN